MQRDFFAVSRSVFDHPLLKDAERFRAWIWMVSRACWKPTPYDVHGKIITLERGQFCCSMRELADAWGWSKSSVDRFLTRLKTETMIGTTSGTGRMVVTICNYEKYQGSENETGTGSGTTSGTAAGHKRTIKQILPLSDGEAPASKYAFEGKTIRLLEKDLEDWKSAYHAIPDIRAELFSLDGWLQGPGQAKQKSWFFTISGILSKKHQELISQAGRQKVESGNFLEQLEDRRRKREAWERENGS